MTSAHRLSCDALQPKYGVSTDRAVTMKMLEELRIAGNPESINRCMPYRENTNDESRTIPQIFLKLLLNDKELLGDRFANKPWNTMDERDFLVIHPATT
jgi:hypothetical protein